MFIFPCFALFLSLTYTLLCLTSGNRDYTSAQTLRVEFGINQEMEQFDRSFKVRQMLGANK